MVTSMSVVGFVVVVITSTFPFTSATSWYLCACQVTEYLGLALSCCSPAYRGHPELIWCQGSTRCLCARSLASLLVFVCLFLQKSRTQIKQNTKTDQILWNIFILQAYWTISIISTEPIKIKYFKLTGIWSTVSISTWNRFLEEQRLGYFTGSAGTLKV